MNIRLVIYGVPDSLSSITPLKQASHPQYGSDREFRFLLLAPAWDLATTKGRADGQGAAGEAAALAQQMAFALGERSNMDSLLLSPLSCCLLPGASLGHMGSGQPQSEISSLYLRLLKLLHETIHQMLCTFIAQGLAPAPLRS